MCITEDSTRDHSTSPKELRHKLITSCWPGQLPIAAANTVWSSTSQPTFILLSLAVLYSMVHIKSEIVMVALLQVISK